MACFSFGEVTRDIDDLSCERLGAGLVGFLFSCGEDRNIQTEHPLFSVGVFFGLSGDQRPRRPLVQHGQGHRGYRYGLIVCMCEPSYLCRVLFARAPVVGLGFFVSVKTGFKP